MTKDEMKMLANDLRNIADNIDESMDLGGDATSLIFVGNRYATVPEIADMIRSLREGEGGAA